MPGLLSGSVSRAGGSNTFIQLNQAQPQLPPTPTTATGFTVVTDAKLVTTYASSLGFLQFTSGTISNQVPGQNIVLAATGTSTVVVSSTAVSYSTVTGALIVSGGVGISGGIWAWNDIHVNGLTIGQGFQGHDNVVIQGEASNIAEDEFPLGHSSIAIGHGTLTGLNTANKSVAIGRLALSSGSNILRTIAIGDSALKTMGVEQRRFVGTLTNAQVVGDDTVITIVNHQLNDGDYITIDYQGEPGQDQEPADNQYYVKVITSSTFSLWLDYLLSDNATTLAEDDFPYFVGSPVWLDYVYGNNTAIGANAGLRLKNGIQNFFIGDNAAQNFVSGSYNYFIGPDVAQNITHGNAIIAIGSDNLVNGIDNQINIGSVFYYDGFGYLQLNADVGLGLGYDSTSTDSGALTVDGGVGISDSVFIGGGLDVSKGNKDVNLSPKGGNVIIEPTLGGSLTIYPNMSGTIDNVELGGNVAGPATITSGRVVSTATSTSTTTGALVVTGGVGIGGNMIIDGLITGLITTATNIAGGVRGSIPYQSTAGNTTLLPIGANLDLLVSNGNTPYWTNANALLSNTTTNAANIFIHTATSALYYIDMSPAIGTFAEVDATPALTYNNVTGVFAIASTTTATNTTTGALQVAGGISTKGSVYSADGSEYDNNLLYVPKVTVSPTPPVNARVGDFWIEPTSGVELQYIADGANRIWIQFTSL